MVHKAKIVGAVDPEWHDMSAYVVHFTKDYGNKSAYDNMLSILYKCKINGCTPFGIGRKLAPDQETQKCACFSEVPAGQLNRLAKVRSRYGIGFSKDFLAHRHGNPILYAYKNSPLLGALKNLMAAAKNDPEADIWKIAPFVDSPGKYGVSEYFYEWEREWRYIGDFKFPLNSVEFLIIPEHLHEAAAGFFEEARVENTGPSYECPFIDAGWSRKKIVNALSQ